MIPSFQNYPALESIIRRHDVLTSQGTSRSRENSLEALDEELGQISHAEPLNAFLQPPTEQNQKSLIQRICDAVTGFFCLPFRNTKPVVTTFPSDTELSRESLIAHHPLVIDGGVLLNQPRKHYGVIAMQPDLEPSPISVQTTFHILHNPLEARSRAFTLPDKLEAEFKVHAWRKNMIKDVVLPEQDACDLIIQDRNYSELAILKQLFTKDENFPRYEHLSELSKEILSSFVIRSRSPILSLLQEPLIARPTRTHSSQ